MTRECFFCGEEWDTSEMKCISSTKNDRGDKGLFICKKHSKKRGAKKCLLK